MAGKWTRIEDVFPIENGAIPASYVRLPDGKSLFHAFSPVFVVPHDFLSKTRNGLALFHSLQVEQALEDPLPTID